MVVLLHFDGAWHGYGWPAVRNAYVAVDFFFVLSGFVIASAYHDRIGGRADVVRFSVRRFGRLYPLHLAVLLIYVAIQGWLLMTGDPAFTGDFGPAALAANLALIQGFGSWALTWNYPAWSISIELWVNLLFAAYLAVAGKRAPWVAIAIVVLCAAFVGVARALALPVSAAAVNQLINVAQGAFAFVLGTLVHRLYSTALGRWRPGTLAEGLAAALVVFVFVQRGHLPQLLAPILFAPVVFIMAHDAGPISRGLASAPCQTLGARSYSIYLTHSLYLLALGQAVAAVGAWLNRPSIGDLAGHEAMILGGPWVMDIAALTCVAAVIVGSGLSYRFIEEPARRFFNALSDGLPPRAALKRSATRKWNIGYADRARPKL